jgi:outer membrane protein assembly factor BamA
MLGPGVYFARFSTVDTITRLVVPAREVDRDVPGFPDSTEVVLEPCDDCADFVPTGGTSVAVINAELRFPSPFLRRQLRLAAFVDAGSVSNGNLWDARDWRITPGVGLRIITPVGPARVDMAYNPYGPITGTLYVLAQDGEIVRARDDFKEPDQGFWGKLQFHVAIGQAF